MVRARIHFSAPLFRGTVPILSYRIEGQSAEGRPAAAADDPDELHPDVEWQDDDPELFPVEVRHESVERGIYMESGIPLPHARRGRYYRYRVVVVTAAAGAQRVVSEWSRPMLAESPVHFVRRRRREKRARGLKRLGAIPE
jgi:hypothetical protein